MSDEAGATEGPGHVVGIVVVSHSREVAQGTAAIALAMAPRVAVVPAGGAAGGELGTDATVIADAIRTADRGSGVVVLVDLGSAVLAASTALELLDGAVPDVRISGGPLVEGAVLGAVEASIGRSVGEVAEATERARDLPKLDAPREGPGRQP